MYLEVQGERERAIKGNLKSKKMKAKLRLS